MYLVIAVVSLAALGFVLSFSRFRCWLAAPQKNNTGGTRRDYISWLGGKAADLFRISWARRFLQLYHEWITDRYSPGVRWIFVCLGISYGYLAVSGFGFTLMGVLRLQGIFLFLHVVLGGLFAVCLSLGVVLRARYYRLDEAVSEVQERSPDLKTSMGIRKLWQGICFWLFTGFGLVLIVTALGLMFPLFSLQTQMDMFEIHRYAALLSLLSVLAFFDLRRGWAGDG